MIKNIPQKYFIPESVVYKNDSCVANIRLTHFDVQTELCKVNFGLKFWKIISPY